MPTLRILALAAIALAGCDPPKTAKGLRYAVVFAESGLELTHGGGRWVEEIYFPDLKVACVLVYEHKELLAGKPAEPRLYAFPADRPRNNLTGLDSREPSAIVEIEVPADVAEEIRKLAELRKRWEDETWRLGAAAASGKLMKELPHEGGPR
jgi:hypothetical protein